MAALGTDGAPSEPMGANAHAAAPSGPPVSWGVVGCGWVARDFAIPAIVDTARLVAVYDADPERGHGLGAPRAQDLAELITADGVEAVYVATPNHAHAAPTLAAAAAGKAVLCEKPMAADPADACAMMAACRAAGVAYATAFDQRCHGAHRTLQRLIAEGALGTLVQARIHYACWLTADWARDNWRIDPKRAGGGAVIDLAPHGIDLIATLSGLAPREVSVMLQRRIHRYGVDDGGLVSVRYDGDLLATIAVGYNCPDALPRRRLEITGTKGAAVAVDTMGQSAGGRLTLTDTSGRAFGVPIRDDRPPFHTQIAAFSAHVRGTSFPSTPEQDLAACKLLHEALARAGAPTAEAPSPPARAREAAQCR